MLAKLSAAGIPMRYKPAGAFLHWKMMIFAGQFTVQFERNTVHQEATWFQLCHIVNFTQDPIVFSHQHTQIVNSFQRKFDDAWVDTVNFSKRMRTSPSSDTGVPAVFNQPACSISLQAQNFLTRVKPHYDAETDRSST